MVIRQPAHHRRAVRGPATAEPRPHQTLDEDVQRLLSYANQMRRANAEGHRLTFTAEAVLDAIQQASSNCSNSICRTADDERRGGADLDSCAAVLAQIVDTIQALRERMTFQPL
jgi:hypothetical protein